MAFTAYFEMEDAWPLETSAVFTFIVIGLLDIRIPFVLIVGYALHGLWNILHELHMHGDISVFGLGQASLVLLAYGILCVSYDLCMAAYFYTRHSEWDAAWASKANHQR